MPSKQVVAVVAAGIIIGLLIITSILSVNNGRLNQRIGVLEGKLAKTGGSNAKVDALESRVRKLTKRVDENAKVTNGNAARYNELTDTVRSVATKAQSRAGGRLTGLEDIKKISNVLAKEMQMVPDRS